MGGDPEVLRIVSQHLRSLGYEAVEAGSAIEALHVLSIDDDFDLLVTDAMLPHEITGMELERRVRRAFGSRIKVLVTDCLKEDVFRQHGTFKEIIPRPPKPDRYKELIWALKGALDIHV